MIFVILVNVGMCEIVLITSKITDYQFSAAIFIFFFFIEVLMWSANYCLGMHAYVWWRLRGTISGEEGGLP